MLDETAEVVRAAARASSSAARATASCAPTRASTPPTRPRDGVVVTAAARPRRLGPRAARRACPARPAVVITDSFGRAWRHGQCDVAIGLAGLAPLDDWRGRRDADGRELRATWIAVADEAAAAADLVRRARTRAPAGVSSRGLERHVTDDDGPGAAALVRAPATRTCSARPRGDARRHAVPRRRALDALGAVTDQPQAAAADADAAAGHRPAAVRPGRLAASSSQARARRALAARAPRAAHRRRRPPRRRVRAREHARARW